MTLRVTLCFLGLSLALASSELRAGKFNPDKNIGDVVPAWNDLPATDGKRYSLKDFDSKDVLVVVFTCNSCPYAVDYEERINELAKKHSSSESRVGLVAINVNKIEADLMPAMTQRAKERGFVFPYLFDETQQIAKDFGAGRTPEVFVLNKDRKIVYMGSLDDNAMASKAKIPYAALAIEATLAGKSIEVEETAPIGCAIRFVRQRK
jgi:peroxiredoxin